MCKQSHKCSAIVEDCPSKFKQKDTRLLGTFGQCYGEADTHISGYSYKRILVYYKGGVDTHIICIFKRLYTLY